MRPPSVEKHNSRQPLWSAEEEEDAIKCHRQLRRNANNCPRRDPGNNRDHKSFGVQEEELIIKLHATVGSRWNMIAQQLPGRTESEVKNCWNTKLKKRLTEMGIDPVTHKPFSQVLRDYSNIGGNTRVGPIHHSKDLRSVYLSNTNSKPQQRRQQQQLFSPIHFPPHPPSAPAMTPNSPSESADETLSWADFLVGDDCFEVNGGQPLARPDDDDPHGNITRRGETAEGPLSSSSSWAADDSFVETLLNKHTETFMDLPEIFG